MIGLAQDALPRGEVIRVQLRVSVDTLIALATAALAVGLAVGFQLLRIRWRSGGAGRS